MIIITAFGSIQTAVQSMKLGAFDYITKPFSNDELMLAVTRALEDRSLRTGDQAPARSSWPTVTAWRTSSPPATR